MSELEDKLNTVLSNPQLMQQLMSVAQTLGAGKDTGQSAEAPAPALSTPPDSIPLQKLLGIAQQGGIDRNQQALLQALTPYLSRDRVTRLHRAMGAARMAGAASALLGSGGLSALTGR